MWMGCFPLPPAPAGWRQPALPATIIATPNSAHRWAGSAALFSTFYSSGRWCRPVLLGWLARCYNNNTYLLLPAIQFCAPYCLSVLCAARQPAGSSGSVFFCVLFYI